MQDLAAQLGNRYMFLARHVTDMKQSAALLKVYEGLSECLGDYEFVCGVLSWDSKSGSIHDVASNLAVRLLNLTAHAKCDDATTADLTKVLTAMGEELEDYEDACGL